MKKLLQILVLLLASIPVFSQFSNQSDGYPKYLMNGKDTVGVVISVEQARKIDNDYDLIVLLKKYKSQCDSTQAAYVSVVDQLNNQIALLNVKISDMDSIKSTQKSMIDNLNQQINAYKSVINIGNQQAAKQNEIITNLTSENKKLKVQKYLGGGLAVVIITFLLLKH